MLFCVVFVLQISMLPVKYYVFFNALRMKQKQKQKQKQQHVYQA